MPRGRWGHGSGFGGGACPRRISRFLEPCLLLLLRGDATHGYNLLEALRQFGFAPGTVDASVVYRILREMEDGGWVSSQWDTAGAGPPRRVYTVTSDGEAYLAAWINDLRCTRDEIDQFIETYTQREAARGAAKSEKAAGEGGHGSPAMRPTPMPRPSSRTTMSSCSRTRCKSTSRSWATSGTQSDRCKGMRR